MKLVGIVLAVLLFSLVSIGCATTTPDPTTVAVPACDNIASCTGCALTKEGACNDRGTLLCNGSARRCANECLHTSGALQCGHTGCACTTNCRCR